MRIPPAGRRSLTGGMNLVIWLYFFERLFFKTTPRIISSTPLTTRATTHNPKGLSSPVGGTLKGFLLAEGVFTEALTFPSGEACELSDAVGAWTVKVVVAVPFVDTIPRVCSPADSVRT